MTWRRWPTLHEVTSARGALLLVDDAHAVGVLGRVRRRRRSPRPGWPAQPDVVVTATLSKSLGGAGRRGGRARRR